MNQINGIFVNDDYAIYAPGRRLKGYNDSQIRFTDGSSVNLRNGAITDTLLGTDRPLVVILLAPGKNTFSFGSLNTSPKTQKWTSNKIQVSYRGAIQILPSTDGKITVEENSHCYASHNDGQVEVAMAEITEITILKSTDGNVSLSNINGNSSREIPTLRIWAPIDTSIEGETKTIDFVELATIDLKCDEVKGSKAQKIILNNMASTKINCPVIVDELNIKTMGEVTLKTKLNTKNICINTSGDVASAFDIVSPVIYIKTMGDVDFKQLSATDTKIETSADVTIESCKTSKLVIKTMGKVVLRNMVANEVRVNTSSQVTIKAGSIERLNIKTMGNVDLNCEVIEDVYINTSGSVVVKIASGHTDTSIKTMGSVDLTLAVSNTTEVNTMGSVSIIAYSFIKKPSIKTMGKKIVDVRI